MKIINIISALITLILLTGHASAISEVSLILPTQRINVGDTFDVRIYIDPNSAEIAGAQANLLFNKSVIRVNSVSKGNLFSRYGASTYFFVTKIDNQTGAVYNIVDVILGQYNVSTPATFAVINVTAVGIGSANFNLSRVIIASPESQAVPLYTVNQSLSSYSISDINGDWTTDLMDIVSVSQHFGEITHYPFPPYDANKDGIVNILDIILIARYV